MFRSFMPEAGLVRVSNIRVIIMIIIIMMSELAEKGHLKHLDRIPFLH